MFQVNVNWKIMCVHKYVWSWLCLSLFHSSIGGGISTNTSSCSSSLRRLTQFNTRSSVSV